jgi:hypothetical protein
MHTTSKYMFVLVLVLIFSINSLFLFQDTSSLKPEIKTDSNESSVVQQQLVQEIERNTTLFDLILNSTTASSTPSTSSTSMTTRNVTSAEDLITITDRLPDVVAYNIPGSTPHLYSSNNFTLVEELNVSPHHFPYLINPEDSICGPNKGADLLLIAFVPISVSNFAGRNSIRQTWSNYNSVKNMKVVFLLGSTQNSTLSQEVFFESHVYGDIIQEDFVDSYRNLTIKTLMGLKWVSTYCYNARFTMKVDDDVVVSTLNLLDFLNQVDVANPTLHNTFLCKYINNGTVERNQSSKFFIPREVYPLDLFPP